MTALTLPARLATAAERAEAAALVDAQMGPEPTGLAAHNDYLHEHRDLFEVVLAQVVADHDKAGAA